MSKVSIYAHTRSSFGEALFSLFGKGRRYAERIYSAWMQTGSLAGVAIEPQGKELFEAMVAATDFSLPQMGEVLEEGEGAKFLLHFDDGLVSESVVIPAETRTTLCISSQVGCKRGCAFCETGKMGLKRSLRAEEMVAQVFHARFTLKRAVRNVVFMGMGEPFDNFDEVMRAVAVLSDSGGLSVGLRRITVSTSGHVEGIRRFAREAPAALNLAVSITSARDVLRRRLMPITKQWGVAEVKEAMQEYLEVEGRAILIGYVLLKGINDSEEDAEALADYLESLKVKVNCIPYNPMRRDVFARPEWDVIDRFIACLRGRGLKVLLRHSRGCEIMAGCGQLGTCSESKSRLG